MGGVADTTYAADGVYHIMNTFSNPVYVVLYLVWLGALWFHLTHGFWSSMQSLAGTTRLDQPLEMHLQHLFNHRCCMLCSGSSRILR